MTYRQLRDILNKMTLTDLEKDITASYYEEELYSVSGVSVANCNIEDRVDDGTLILYLWKK